MRILIDETASEPLPEVLLVLLTGTFSQPEDFIREGFVAAVRERGLVPEIALVGTPPARVADGTFADDLHEAVAAPARARGRSRIWLAGVSLGGQGALSYAARHEADIEGLVLLAPYPGTRDLAREIDSAGGLAAWHRRPAVAGDTEREAWNWLATCRDSRVSAYLYYGEHDRFADGQSRMGDAMRPDRVHRIAGKHDWPTWRRAWNRFLDDHAALLTENPRASPAGKPRQPRGMRA